MKDSSRRVRILSAIIDKFLEFGEPVGSKTVSELLENEVSSATVRNEMAELAILGYLIKPHVSSGRIPSVQGYRFYVDKLLNLNKLAYEEENFINEALLSAAFEPEKFMKEATRVLAELTLCVTFSVVRPNLESKIIEIKIMQVGVSEAILAIKMDSGMLKSLIFKCDYPLTPEILVMFEKILSEKFCGLSLRAISEKFDEMLTNLASSVTRFLMPIITALSSVSKQAGKFEVETAGRNNLLKFNGIDFEHVAKIFDILDNSEKMGKIFFEGNYTFGQDVSVFIGEENPKAEFKATTLVITSARFGGKSGVLGVICPVPTNFSRIASVLSHVSKTINSISGF